MCVSENNHSKVKKTVPKKKMQQFANKMSSFDKITQRFIEKGKKRFEAEIHSMISKLLFFSVSVL
jgi:hypothetical protein